ncbi:hypothetical protein EFA69_16055 [Rufibacter immobilis]|uniref:Uncharacterized protein n=1 Tax=Rufibacter immobilis TaxID=1348778 RepID=A0A3M9MQ43_9BACT|nr:hypothetical protein [Rufibacter immobilis]RNI27630.1 hypothetical protein EFA69_16055 [Rufibacter immobilis]
MTHKIGMHYTFKEGVLHCRVELDNGAYKILGPQLKAELELGLLEGERMENTSEGGAVYELTFSDLDEHEHFTRTFFTMVKKNY